MKGILVEYLKLIRLPGWGAYSITAVFGALSTGESDVQKLGILFLIGILSAIYGFVLNDYADVKTDSLSKDLLDRPLVKGSIPRRNALIIALSAAVFGYSIVFIGIATKFFLFRFEPIIILSVAALLTVIYNFYSKSIVGSDLFVATAVALYCLFGAMLVSYTLSGLTWIIVIVTFIQVFYMNTIIGGLKDADHDYKLGGKNIALKLGVKVDKKVFIPLSFKVLALVLRSSSALFIFIPLIFYTNFPYYLWQPVLMFLMFAGVFYTTIKMLNIESFERNLLRKLFSIQAFLRYSIVPVMLIKFIGLSTGLFLIIFPFVWYAVLNRLIYGKVIQPGTL